MSPKFLEGTRYNGSQVATCAFWSLKAVTDASKDFADLVQEENPGFCIANHYFKTDDISCFNFGSCNGEGKCLPCTKYKAPGMGMGITHSPPLDFIQQVNSNPEDPTLSDPQTRIVDSKIFNSLQDQLPFNILLRNIQAEVAKCCFWSSGDGNASKFFITPIIDGPDTLVITNALGNQEQLKGIRVENSVFPDGNAFTKGAFFPVGTNVVAGWESEPSFYLEPRTGLVKSGEGVIFKSNSNSNTSLSRSKSIAPQSSPVAQNAISAIQQAVNQTNANLSSIVNSANNLLQSNAPSDMKEDAQNRVIDSQLAVNAINEALTEAIILGADIESQIEDVTSSTEPEMIVATSSTLAESLLKLADQVEIANVNSQGEPASGTLASSNRLLLALAQELQFSGKGGFSKCSFVFTVNNVAKQWNLPEDGSLPCNGMRSDCKFYTGPPWKYATTEKLEIGKPILAEAIQEIRFHSDDWSRFSNPEEEFRNRFSVPFIWAFKEYIDSFGNPDVEDMLLHRPKILFARRPNNLNAPEDNPNTLDNAFETMLVSKIGISDFDDLKVSKSVSPIRAGQSSLDNFLAPSFPTTISSFSVPSSARLKITHPQTSEPFIYRSWSPRFTNRISIFGSATPSQTIFIVNDTALRARDRYHEFFGTKNVFEIPSGLPGAGSDFRNIRSSQLLEIFDQLEKEKDTNDSEAVLGFDITSSNTTGFWESLIQVDLVHQALNEIYVFLIVNDQDFIFDKVVVDHRALHAVVGQETFTSTDFTIQDVGGPTGGSKLGSVTSSIVQNSQLTASVFKLFGREDVKIDHGYYAWRFKDRNLRASTLNDKNDLIGSSTTVDVDSSTFITNVSYRVVQYREVEIISNWRLLQDCGLIIAEISSPNVHRVLPLPDQNGNVKALSPVLINNGVIGSVEAQWAPEFITLNIDGQDKDMVLIYRNPDGVGLPANFLVCGPAPGEENLFGRPDPNRDTLTIQYTYLRAQTHKRENAEEQNPPEGTGEVVNENFYGDNLRTHKHSFTISETGLEAGGARPNHIALEQQDYCFVFSDSEGRPIGRKVTRFAVCYYNLAVVNVEIFYAWNSNCITYGLVPDLFSGIGNNSGTTLSALKGTIDPDDLTLGRRVSNLLGPHTCMQTPNCGDHEVLSIGPIRKEFEVISDISEPEEGSEEKPPAILKAFFPSAAQAIEGQIISAEPPGTQWLLKRGAMWYPYTVCERPRYRKSTNGPLQTDTTELINSQTGQAGIATGSFGPGTIEPGTGTFGPLPEPSEEAYRGYDEVVARILDHHPSLRACTLDYTYGNTIRISGDQFVGFARKRGEIDLFWYEGLGWTPPPFGNFGRNMVFSEVSTKVGDYSPQFMRTAFRWMPLFPEREDMMALARLFGEGPEPESVFNRLIGQTNPLGATGEVFPEEPERFTHTSLIGNRVGTVTYPHVPFFPTFLPDSLLGLEPSAQGIGLGGTLPRASVSTAWAWREPSLPIRRAVNNSEQIRGLHLQLPDYFLNNQRMEVRIRPEEGFYTLSYTAPTYDSSGKLVANGSLKLGSNGPPREVVIDFENRVFAIANQPGTFYDSSLILGDEPFSCSIQASSNLSLSTLCSCEGSVAEDSEFFPAIFIHGDSIAPSGFFVLYSTDNIGPAFPTDLPQAAQGAAGPSNLCNYFIEQVYFRLDSTFLPVSPKIDPAFSQDIVLQYTWSRVPHGLRGGFGQDLIFNGIENRAQNLVEAQGVLTTRVNIQSNSLFSQSSITAFFPSTEEAQLKDEQDVGILVANALSPGDPKLLGGVAAQLARSRGQTEQITLDMVLSTYVSIRQVKIFFLAGKGMEIPEVILTGIPPQNRIGEFVTTRTGRVLGTSSVSFVGKDVPNSNTFPDDSLEEGRALFSITIVPNYENISFWDKFYQEFHLIFGQRSSSGSMGIHSIEMEVEGLLPTQALTETIFIPERKYYRSTFTPVNKNPEQFLTGVDNATAYWRNTSIAFDSGSNRSRAYVWDTKINNETGTGQGGGRPTITGPIEELELLQRDEYNLSRDLMERPYSYRFTSFFHPEERRWIELLGGTIPFWNTRLSVDVGDIDKVSRDEGDVLLYGVVPEREPWHAPGHAWRHILEDATFVACCETCAFSQIVSYEFLHLHDGLASFEPTGFFAGGLLTGSRSIVDNPDIVLLEAGQLSDTQGNAIPSEVLDASGIARDPDTGNLIIQ